MGLSGSYIIRLQLKRAFKRHLGQYRFKLTINTEAEHLDVRVTSNYISFTDVIAIGFLEISLQEAVLNGYSHSSTTHLPMPLFS